VLDDVINAVVEELNGTKEEEMLGLQHSLDEAEQLNVELYKKVTILP